jgi:hypothetical protein
METSALAHLSYDAAIRSLDLQERAVEQLRARTATLLAASSLTASFLGAQTIQHAKAPGALDTMALVSFVGSIGLCVCVLIPRSAYVFSVSGAKMYERAFDVANNDEEVRRRLIYWFEEYWTNNQARIEVLDRCYLAAAVALILQLSFWCLALVSIIPQS